MRGQIPQPLQSAVITNARVFRSLALFVVTLFGAAGASTAQTPNAPAIAPQSLVYTASTGVTYTLRSLKGHSVTIGFPDVWLDPGRGGLTSNEAQTLVDLSDIAYYHYTDLLGGEPVPGPVSDTPLLIAIVPIPFSGNTYVGWGRTEINPNQLADVRDNLRRGILSVVWLHEMAHAFDLYHQYILDSYSDSTHAWTTLMVDLIRLRMKADRYAGQTEGALADTAALFTTRWNAHQPAGPLYSACVRSGTGCEADGISSNRAWAGFVLRYVRLFDQQSLKAAFAWLAVQRANNVAAPSSIEARNDMFVEALARGAGKDVSCVIDAWRWEITPDLRARLHILFPTAPAECADADHDTFSPAMADPDDHDSLRTPLAVDVTNGRDDEGDGFRDDTLIAASTTTSATTAVATPPFRIRGNASSPGQTFNFAFDTDRPRALTARVFSTSPSTSFLVRIAETGAQAGSLLQFTIDSTWITSIPLVLPRPGHWSIQIQRGDAAPGTNADFDILVVPSYDDTEPSSRWLTILPTADPAGVGIIIQAQVSAPPALLSQSPTIRFFATGRGAVCDLPLDSQGHAGPWTWAPSALPTTNVSQLRAELILNGEVVAPLSQGMWVERGTNGEVTLIPSTSDLQLSVRSSFAGTATSADLVDATFEVINNGPDAVANAVVSIAVDPALTTGQRLYTQGSCSLANQTLSFHLGALMPGERVALYVTAAAWAAAGRTVALDAQLIAISGEQDPVSSNNGAALRLTIGSPPDPFFSYNVSPLPLDRQAGPQDHAINAGSLARATALLPTVIVNSQLMGHVDSLTGNWINPAAGIALAVNSQPAKIVSVTPVAGFDSSRNYAVDFVVPPSLTSGVQLEYMITDARTGSLLFQRSGSDTLATVQDTAPPALWSTGAMATALTGDRFIAITPLAPAEPGAPLVLYAGNLRSGVLPPLWAMTADGSLFPVTVVRADQLPSVPGTMQLAVRLPEDIRGAGRVLLLFSTSTSTSANNAYLPVR